jgi:type VI secretion system protein ImpC
MKKPISFGKLDFDLVTSLDNTSGELDPDMPFRILILGDFSGRTNRRLFEPKAAILGRLLQVDRDNLDEVIEKIGIEARLQLFGEEEPPVSLRFRELDDFHPDRLFEQMELFRAICNKRKIIADPSFLVSARGKLCVPAPAEDIALRRVVSQSTGSLLDQVLEETAGEDSKKDPVTRPSEWDSFLDSVVQPHTLSDNASEQAHLLAELDDTIGELMRAILHFPDFQAIEAAWRGVDFLISRLDAGNELKLYLLDISKEELAEELQSEDLGATGIFRLLIEQTPEAYPWGLVAGNFFFDSSIEDLEALGRMSLIAAAGHVSFVTATDTALLGSERGDWSQDNEAWNMLRQLPEAAYLRLSLPGFLLRLPYGQDTDPTELFDFEEMPLPCYDQYLWGNPVFASTFLIGEAFSASGWAFKPGMVQDIENLPLHIYKAEEESHVTPCTGTLLTEDAVEALMDMGLMPLISFKARDIVRVARFHSIANPPSLMSGSWNSN